MNGQPSGHVLQPATAFLAGGGEMGALMRAHDWTASCLGPPAQWPQSLRMAVRLMLNTGHPMYVFWGAQGACLYNDAYRESIGPERHPRSLGRPAREVWDEIWPIIGPQIEQVMAGRGATWHVDALVPTTRHGRLEDVYWTYSYSPIDDETAPGGVGGVLVVCRETTQQVLAARQLADERDRLARLFAQAPAFMALLDGPEHRFEIVNPMYLQLVGERELLGRTVAQALPETVEQGFVALLDGVYASGEAYSAHGIRYLKPATPDGPPRQYWLDFVYQPIKDRSGRVTGIFVLGSDVSERARADEALRASEERFRSALHAGRMGSWETDFGAGTRLWSKEGMDLFGIDLPGGRGRVGGDEDEYVAALHPDDRHLVAVFRELANQVDSFPAEYRIVRPDGTTLWLSGRGMVVAREPDGRARHLVSIMADTTERKQAELALRVERERLSLAFSAGQMGAFDLDMHTGVLWWSPQTYALSGVRAGEFVPSLDSIGGLIHPDDREGFWRSRAEAIAEHRPSRIEFRVRRDGRDAWLAMLGHADYDAQGRPVRSFGIVMDITERKHAEQALREVDLRKDRFIATLAHELRNPLAPIRNAIDVLRRAAPGDPRAVWCHDVIARQTGRMAHLLDDLLDVSRISRNHLQLRRQTLRLGTVIDHALEIARPVIDAAGHTLSLKLTDRPLVLDGDLTRLAQVFSNVLINAAKYTPPQGRIELRAEVHRGEAVVTVIDNGIGIAAEHLTQIFEMFGQVESALSRAQGGQGIGLSLARGLIEMHGGTIVARSDGPGRGSEFELRLPLALQDAAGPCEVPDPVQGEAAEIGAQACRILIADDLRDITDSLALLLGSLGHTVYVAYDGEQALRLAAAHRPDVVLLDLGMPRLTGYEVCRRIRAEAWGARMVLVAQTGWGRDDDRLRSQDAGFDHHLTKPVDPAALQALFRASPGST
jgi:PAS domain S-box-containing protein